QHPGGQLAAQHGLDGVDDHGRVDVVGVVVQRAAGGAHGGGQALEKRPVLGPGAGSEAHEVDVASAGGGEDGGGDVAGPRLAQLEGGPVVGVLGVLGPGHPVQVAPVRQVHEVGR